MLKAVRRRRGEAVVLKIQFATEDLPRIRRAPRPDPLWELLLAVQLLRTQPGDLLFTGWRREVTDRLRRAELGESLTLLLSLMPHLGYFPDFLNPPAAGHGLDEGLEAVRSTPKARLHHDVSRLAATRRLPDTARTIAAGSRRALADLTDTMRVCYELMVLPYRRAIDAAFDGDRRRRLEAFADNGVPGLLDSLRPLAYWSAGELHVPHHRDQRLPLDNRGLLLIPAYFCIGAPVTLFDPVLPPVLVYPANPSPHLLPTGGQTCSTTALAALIGATRTAVLDAIRTRRTITTTELASHLALSMASTSEQTRILRDAGLITSRRDRNRLHHQLTPLGHALLTDHTTEHPETRQAD
jgi:DNA-binding transcriptional ArsR family regulator